MAEHLLEVRNLSVEFHTAAGVVKAVKGISWYLDRGETLAILGESGSGKSVSASAILDLIDMPPGRITSGEIRFDGKDLLKHSASQRRDINGRKIAMIFQDPLSHLNPVYPVGWQIVEALTTHGVDRASAHAEALRLVTRVGIPEPENALKKYPHQFSGGQRQRLMIAQALIRRPRILFFDEATSALDNETQRTVIESTRALNATRIVIAHRLSTVLDADRVIVMEDGKVAQQGAPAELLADTGGRLHELVRRQLA